jgi:hypothetical protein
MKKNLHDKEIRSIFFLAQNWNYFFPSETEKDV